MITTLFEVLEKIINSPNSDLFLIGTVLSDIACSHVYIRNFSM